MLANKMILPLILLLSIPAIYADEFPNLMQYIKVTWENVDLTSTISGSQTVSAAGEVSSFTLCGNYNNTKGQNADCAYTYSYSEFTGSGTISGKGSGSSSLATYLSKTSNTDSCVSFHNWIPTFKDVYNAQESKRGSWKVEYTCKLVSPFPTGIVVAVLIVALLGAGGFFGYKYLQKKKNAQTTTGGGYMATP